MLGQVGLPVAPQISSKSLVADRTLRNRRSCALDVSIKPVSPQDPNGDERLKLFGLLQTISDASLV